MEMKQTSGVGVNPLETYGRNINKEVKQKRAKSPFLMQKLIRPNIAGCGMGNLKRFDVKMIDDKSPAFFWNDWYGFVHFLI